MNLNLCFIGGGHMARSLIGGLIARGAPGERICVADPVAAQLESLRKEYGVRTTHDNLAAAGPADVVILAVKPQELRTVAMQLRPALEVRPRLLISIAAGIRASDIRRWTGGGPVVRCMPNRPALQGCGVTGLFASADVDADGRRTAEEILGPVGETVWLNRESDMDAVTALSGSGPAYFFLLIEMLEQAGVQLGLSPEVSRTLAVETAFGSGCMARAAGESPATLREQVTSKGGTTEAALKHLEAHDVRALFRQAVFAAARRSAELAEEFGRTP
ncbi:MAG TPA: pyrroline-5-carboxylate reductase [Steroidobacter sp.]|jgi:pyrroline-5-carboxylate reductase|nr:pyrroline-5-carboxylate reductase [Steroidobacter sp.]